MAGKKKRSARATSGVIGLVVVVASALIALFALNSAKGFPGESHTYVKAQFTNTGDLHVDDDLREADVRVGRVDNIDYEGNGVGTVRLQFDDDNPVYKNATVQVVSRSGLGQKYVNITRGDPAAGAMPTDGVIPASQTQPAVEILDLADIFDPKTTVAAQGALGQLGAGMRGPREGPQRRGRRRPGQPAEARHGGPRAEQQQRPGHQHRPDVVARPHLAVPGPAAADHRPQPPAVDHLRRGQRQRREVAGRSAPGGAGGVLATSGRRSSISSSRSRRPPRR